MSKQMPYMVLDLTKKPGDEDAVKTGDMLLAENERMRKALKSIKQINDARPHDAQGYEINDIIEAALGEGREGGEK